MNKMSIWVPVGAALVTIAFVVAYQALIFSAPANRAIATLYVLAFFSLWGVNRVVRAFRKDKQ